MVAAFRDSGLGQMLDFVPNHMGVGGADNPLVARRAGMGPGFRLCRLVRHRLGPGPTLSARQAAGAVPRRPVRRRAGSGPARAPIRAGDRRVSRSGPTTRTSCRSARCTTSACSATSIRRWSGSAMPFPACRTGGRRSRRRAEELQGRAGRAGARARRCAAGDRRPRSAGSTASRDDSRAGAALDALIQEQHWRAAHFRVAADDINYRRFFNINELAGLRMELPELFDHAHRLVFRLLRDGMLDGSAHRPCRRAARSQGLSAAAARAGAAAVLSRRREDPGAARGAARGLAGRGHHRLRIRQSGARRCWSIRRARTAFDPDLSRTSPASTAPSRDRARLQAPHHGQRDGERAERARPRCGARGAAEPAHRRFHPQHPAARAASEIVACFPVYRTYVDGDGAPTDADRRDLDWAVAQARRNETGRRSQRLRFPAPAADRAIWWPSRAAASAAMRCCASRCSCSNTAAR